MRSFQQEQALCCSSFSLWMSLVLLLFSTISSYWTWGHGVAPYSLNQNSAMGTFYVSLGPWVAGKSWSAYYVPCACSNGFCTGVCYVDLESVRWGSISPNAACDPKSIVYETWAEPLGYCEFPEGFPIPAAAPTLQPNQLPPGTTGQGSYGNVPAGTTFSGPSEMVAMQALTIIATITCAFAALSSCAGAGANQKLGSAIAFPSVACTLISWVFSLASVCLWASIDYVNKVQANPPLVNIPVWADQSQNYLTIVQARDLWLGPAWGTALAATILIFLANLWQLGFLCCQKNGDDMFPPQPDQGAGGVPRSSLFNPQTSTTPTPEAGNVAKSNQTQVPTRDITRDIQV